MFNSPQLTSKFAHAHATQALLQRSDQSLGLDLPGSTNMLALLQSGRVVVLPNTLSPQRLPRLATDLERGAPGALDENTPGKHSHKQLF